MKTPEEIFYKNFKVNDKIGMMKEQFIGLGAQGIIVKAMKEYAKQWIDKASEIPTLEIDHYPIQNLKKDIDAQ